jgi:peptide/nickel transport system substrate-binding protein
MEFARFDDYYQGRPSIDQIILKYIADPTAMVANVLAGSVDMVTPPGVDVDGAVALRDRWAGTGNQVMLQLTNAINSAYSIQFRPEFVRPRAGLPNRDVREALYRAIDKTAMSEGLTHGLAPLADSWVGSHHALRPEVEASIPQYPFDLARAQQLLAGAGWVRGPDGILVHQPSGERFTIEVSGQQRAVIQKQQAIIADHWKLLGADVETHVTPPALDSDRRYESTRPGVLLGSIGDRRFFLDKAMHSRETTSEENRWASRNKGGYSNPVSDRLLDQLGRTIDVRERTAIVRDLVRIQMEDIPIMPFFWEVEPVVALANVKIPQGKTLPEYVFEWRKD